MFYIYFFAEDVHLVCTERPNIDNNNLKINFGDLLYMRPENIKRNISNIQTTEKKLANAVRAVKIAVIFNNTYLSENLLQRFSNIKHIYLYRYIQI